MYAIADLKRITGLTDHQIRDRLTLLSATFPGDLRRGLRGKILAGDKLLAALQRMTELERAGLSPKEAQGEVLKELGNTDGDGHRSLSEGWERLLQEKDQRIEALEERIKEQAKIIDWQQREIDRLQDLLHRQLRRRGGGRGPGKGRGRGNNQRRPNKTPSPAPEP